MRSLLPRIRTRLSTTLVTSSRNGIRPLSSTAQLAQSGTGVGENREQANDPTDRKAPPNISKTNEVAVDNKGAQDGALQESVSAAETNRQMQSPNRQGIWSRSQMPRDLAMTGPRFEQTIMEVQPQPYAAIDLIHKQPVRWVDQRIVACDGGGGPLGHPKIFINVDKPKINWCTYCGLPYAHKHHKKHIESLPSNEYPLKPSDDPAQVQMPQTPSQMGEIDAAGGPYSQR